MPSGFMPQNPAELLGFIAIRQWIAYFKEHNLYDMVIFDTPPILAVPDAAILAANINARVLLVLQANSTRRIEAQQAKQRFEQIKIDIDGIILNQVSSHDDSYYGYRYDDYYADVSSSSNSEDTSK
jgi:tyrosine-protein kinase Etk/Wzc